MEAQVLRRLYENVYVFNYSSSAQMHVLWYLCGFFFYLAAPLSMCSLCVWEVSSYIITQVVLSILRQRACIVDIELKFLEYGNSLLKLGWWQWTGAFVFMWGWIHQLWCHKILASLWTGNQEKTNEYAIRYGNYGFRSHWVCQARVFNAQSEPHGLQQGAHM